MDDAISDTLLKAREAIARARALTLQLTGESVQGNNSIISTPYSGSRNQIETVARRDEEAGSSSSYANPRPFLQRSFEHRNLYDDVTEQSSPQSRDYLFSDIFPSRTVRQEDLSIHGHVDLDFGRPALQAYDPQEDSLGNYNDQERHSDDTEENTSDAASSSGILPVNFLENPLDPCLQTNLLSIVRSLALLQVQQSNTMRRLLNLRQEGLRIRQQQLQALRQLLLVELDFLEGTESQKSAVSQALALLNDSARDMRAAGLALRRSGAAEAEAVCDAITQADKRAGEVSAMARQLLAVLREFPRRADLASAAGRGAAAPEPPPGASRTQISSLPVVTCATGSKLFGRECAICLDSFASGDALRSLHCFHYFHRGCLDEWLFVRAACPLCKTPLDLDPPEEFRVRRPAVAAGEARRGDSEEDEDRDEDTGHDHDEEEDEEERSPDRGEGEVGVVGVVGVEGEEDEERGAGAQPQPQPQHDDDVNDHHDDHHEEVHVDGG